MLVLTDFSPAADHAAKYAARLTHDLDTKRLILYHAYQAIVPVSEVTPFTQVIDLESLHKTSLQQLETVKRTLAPLVSAGTTIDCRTEETVLTPFINDIAEEEKVDMLVMGTTGKSTLEKVLVGSNTLRVVKESHYPVLIVPPQASIAPLEKILFACDLEKTKENLPAAELTKVLDRLRAPLMVVNVDHEEKRFGPDTPRNVSIVYRLLEPYHASFHFIDNDDVIEGIMNFAEENDASLILMHTRNRGFFESLFHRSTTKQMIYHTTLPLLLLHGKTHPDQPGAT